MPRLCRSPWLRAGFTLLLVGYGTKMGLAPMHTWKPDAYGEAPGVVGALLAGRHDELRVPRARATDAGHRGGGRGGVRQPPAGADRARLDGGRRCLAARPARSQAHARLLERRAHGHSRARRWARRRRDVRDAAAPGQQRARQGRCSFSPSATSTAPSAARRPTRCAARCAGCRSPARSSCSGFFAVTGSPPFGLFVSELLILASMFAAQRWLRRRPLPRPVLLRGLRRHGRDLARGAARDGRRRAPAASDYRDRFATVAPALLLLGSCCSSACTCPPLYGR